jgi:predicted ArsR family transcriptional regulator
MASISSRQKILNLLDATSEATATELSRALGVTPADLRYHLSKMVEEGLVTASNPKPTGRKGRPARRFSLTSKTSKSNYDLLASVLLEAIADHLSDEQRNHLLQSVAGQIKGSYKPQGPPGARLVQAVDRLNSLNYQARWEAHADGPRVIFEHCPYAALRPDHPELCRLDTNLIENMLNAAVEQIRSEAHIEDGYCLFNL